MIGHTNKVGEHKWHADLQAWIVDGHRPKPERQAELTQIAHDRFQAEIMQRLEEVRTLFHSMNGKQERKAAHEWLRVVYDL